MFFSQYFSFSCQYHSTIAPYSFIHLPSTLYNVFLPVLQFPLSVSFHQFSTVTWYHASLASSLLSSICTNICTQLISQFVHSCMHSPKGFLFCAGGTMREWLYLHDQIYLKLFRILRFVFHCPVKPVSPLPNNNIRTFSKYFPCKLGHAAIMGLTNMWNISVCKSKMTEHV